MNALLLAAGLGMRLRPLTNTIPKCMVDINGRPLLDYWVELLCAGGINKLLINLHYLPEPVLAYVESSRHQARLTTVYEKTLLGTGGTLLRNRAFFGIESAMLVHADNLSSFDVAAFVGRHEQRPKGVEVTMMTFRATDPESCGIVELDAVGIVRAFHEKVKNPPGNLANAAVYIVTPAVIDFLASLEKEIIDFSTAVLPYFIGRINTFHNDVYHRDIGTLESLHAARKEFTAKSHNI